MSCSADYYLEWNSRLDLTLQTEPKRQIFATQNHKKMRENILLLTLEALTDYSALTMRYSRNSMY
jgi:hypothetical protein